MFWAQSAVLTMPKFPAITWSEWDIFWMSVFDFGNPSIVNVVHAFLTQQDPENLQAQVIKWQLVFIQPTFFPPLTWSHKGGPMVQ